MVESPITTKSALPYQIAIFILINLMGFICYDMAQYQMVTLYENPLSWIGMATLLLSSMLPVLGLCSWKLKDHAKLQNPKWEFKIREVSLQEFRVMITNYNKSYKHLISSIDYILILLASICYIAILALPFYLMSTNLLIISFTPAILSLISIIFGFLFSYFIFKLLPNSVPPEFPTYQPRKFRKAISFLIGLPGIFWVGVKLTIGEADGYYTLRNPIPIARIEGIEGAARIECEIDSSGNITRIIPSFESEEITPSKQLDALCEPITPVTTAKLIRLMIQEYLRHRGGEEILDDVLDDIGSFLSKYDTIDEASE